MRVLTERDISETCGVAHIVNGEWAEYDYWEAACDDCQWRETWSERLFTNAEDAAVSAAQEHECVAP